MGVLPSVPAIGTSVPPSGETALARRLWTRLEPVHAVTYFTPEARTAFEAAGLRGFWRGYFAGRAAPLGPTGPGLVTALFFGFAPAMVARALPGVWELAAPDRVLAARQEGAVAALRRLLPADAPVARIAELLDPVLAGLDCGGRGLAAANAGLDPPAEPLARLWHAGTVLREHRGDGHVAALVAAGVDGCESLVWRAALDLPRESLQPNRGWADDQWLAAQRRLADRGWLNEQGRLTEDGRRAHDEVEAATDRAAAGPWLALDDRRLDELLRLLTPVGRAAATGLRYPNPVGVPSIDPEPDAGGDR